jgi:hypothetical protein
MESSYLSDIALETIREHPLTSQQTKLQRHRYLYNAYSSIKLETVQGIQGINTTLKYLDTVKIPQEGIY